MSEKRAINYLGVVAGIIAFVSLALPWWTMVASAAPTGVISPRLTVAVDLYPHQATASLAGETANVVIDFWFGQPALALIVIAGIAAIVGSLIVGKTGKVVLTVAGILALLSIIIFAAGLQSELSKTPQVEGFPMEVFTMEDYPKVGLFSRISWSYNGITVKYSTYLSFGFWVALIAAIMTFISLGKHPIATLEAPPTPEPETA